MVSLAEIMAGLEEAIAGVVVQDGTRPLRVSDVQPSQINPPQAVVGVPPIDTYHTSLAGMRAGVSPTITVYTSNALDRIGQVMLAELADPAGPGSIPAAINADKTLGGRVGDTQVVRFEPLGLEEVGVLGYFGGRFTLRVLP